MARFFFTTPEDVEYEITCTTNISVNQNAVVTKSPVESGKSIVDNYYLDNRVVTFSGIITSITTPNADNSLNIDINRMIDEIKAIREQKLLVNVHYDRFQIVPNCVITQFDISKSKDEGNSGWRTTMVFQEVDISERARLVEVPKAKEEQKDVTDPKSKTSTSNKVAVGDKLAETIPVSIFSGGN